MNQSRLLAVCTRQQLEPDVHALAMEMRGSLLFRVAVSGFDTTEQMTGDAGQPGIAAPGRHCVDLDTAENHQRAPHRALPVEAHRDLYVRRSMRMGVQHANPGHMQDQYVHST